MEKDKILKGLELRIQIIDLNVLNVISSFWDICGWKL
jgi:hypothetical protein